MLTKAERCAQELLTRHGVVEPSTPIAKIANAEGILIVEEPFRDDEVSGVLLREPEGATIIVNAANASVRQRFTIAHEIGHYKLHKGAVYLDGRARINFRYGQSSKTTNREEIEANTFAAALLMPSGWVHTAFESIVRQGTVNSEEEIAEILAGHFDVSRQAMQIGLVNMGLVVAP